MVKYPDLISQLRFAILTAVLIVAFSFAAARATPYSDEVLQHLSAGRSLVNRGNYESAKNELNLAVKADPKCIEALNNLGVVYLRTQDLASAKSQFEHVLDIDPHFAPSLNNLAQVYSLQGDNDAAVSFYKEALVYARENLWEVHTNLANVLRDKNAFLQAADHYKKAIALNPRYANAHCGYSKLLLLTRQYAEAKKQAIEAINLKKDYAMAYFHLGLAESKLNEKANALKAYTLSLNYEKNPQYAQETRQYIDELNLPAANPASESLDEYQNSLRQNLARTSMSEPHAPKSAAVPARQAERAQEEKVEAADQEQAHALMAKRQWSKARAEFITLLRSQSAPDPVVLNDVGLCYASEKQYDKALSYYKRAVDASEGSCYNALYNLGQIYRLKGNLKSAETTFDLAISEARKQNKTCPLALNALALVLKAKGDLSGAESNYKLAILNGGNDYPVFYYNYAILLEKTYRTREAVDKYKLYLQMAPDGTNVKQAKARLRRLLG
jgi:tetratricopeptide (TPR) repeat protein